MVIVQMSNQVGLDILQLNQTMTVETNKNQKEKKKKNTNQPFLVHFVLPLFHERNQRSKLDTTKPKSIVNPTPCTLFINILEYTLRDDLTSNVLVSNWNPCYFMGYPNHDTSQRHASLHFAKYYHFFKQPTNDAIICFLCFSLDTYVTSNKISITDRSKNQKTSAWNFNSFHIMHEKTLGHAHSCRLCIKQIASASLHSHVPGKQVRLQKTYEFSRKTYTGTKMRCKKAKTVYPSSRMYVTNTEVTKYKAQAC